mmetsp:Transcript_32308/g.54056  ORF Transcript_32308/g.54056 Transcript_32308/m.54056 type:complete len:335 (-) Transcript_32308:876-1880(-)
MIRVQRNEGGNSHQHAFHVVSKATVAPIVTDIVRFIVVRGTTTTVSTVTSAVVVAAVVSCPLLLTIGKRHSNSVIFVLVIGNTGRRERTHNAVTTTDRLDKLFPASVSAAAIAVATNAVALTASTASAAARGDVCSGNVGILCDSFLHCMSDECPKDRIATTTPRRRLVGNVHIPTSTVIPSQKSPLHLLDFGNNIVHYSRYIHIRCYTISGSLSAVATLKKSRDDDTSKDLVGRMVVHGHGGWTTNLAKHNTLEIRTFHTGLEWGQSLLVIFCGKMKLDKVVPIIRLESSSGREGDIPCGYTKLVLEDAFNLSRGAIMNPEIGLELLFQLSLS